MTTSTLFINSITNIDYACIDPNKLNIKGCSLNLSVEITSDFEFDFDTIKKSIKNLINDEEEGFNHKLWVPKDHGGDDDFKLWFKSGSCSYKRIAMFPQDDGQVLVSTPLFTLTCPRNAIKVCSYGKASISSTIKDYLEEKISTQYPDSIISVKVYLTDRPTLPFEHNSGNEVSFTYIHGLKNSFNWGCQNIVHGHKSWLLFVDGYGNIVYPSSVFKLKIDDYMDNHLFVCRDNIVSDDSIGLNIEYQTPRGQFSLIVDKASIKTHIIDTEPTVGHLAEWFVSYFKEDVIKMMEMGATAMYFSEGLIDGARIRLKEKFGDITI